MSDLAYRLITDSRLHRLAKMGMNFHTAFVDHFGMKLWRKAEDHRESNVYTSYKNLKYCNWQLQLQHHANTRHRAVKLTAWKNERSGNSYNLYATLPASKLEVAKAIRMTEFAIAETEKLYKSKEGTSQVPDFTYLAAVLKERGWVIHAPMI